jgi:hypothetical protein
MNQAQKSSRRDHLTLTTKEGKIELTEEQVSRVTGGAFDAFLKYDAFMKIG